MSSQEFPFGNDLSKPDDWLGLSSTKSERWQISYEGSLTFACGYHSFIFLGLDSLAISLVTIYNCGPSLSVPIGKVFKSTGGTSRGALDLESANEKVGNSKKINDAINTDREQRNATTGMALYERMKRGIPQVIFAAKPFSFDDLAVMPGGIVGAEIEIGAAAGLYRIDGYDGVKGGMTSDYFFSATVANAGTGLVSAGVGVSAGVWSVEGSHNLYWELSTGSRARCSVENTSPSYDQPYRQIPNLNPYLQSLPPAGCSLDETHFNPMKTLQRGYP
ncbi:Uncharacterised protein [Bordetella ansorpii]|uniref:Uncharacterized protein n=1 Tax=Bordetella ansorpii TaxID=288768 RepID=A0A157PV65_9BORD|nr:hypothetical protein [Bordetella ansorpii]SAI37244.1 Uncharacterised protein [Bordetella ansorpii]